MSKWDSSNWKCPFTPPCFLVFSICLPLPLILLYSHRHFHSLLRPADKWRVWNISCWDFLFSLKSQRKGFFQSSHILSLRQDTRKDSLTPAFSTQRKKTPLLSFPPPSCIIASTDYQTDYHTSPVWRQRGCFHCIASLWIRNCCDRLSHLEATSRAASKLLPFHSLQKSQLTTFSDGKVVLLVQHVSLTSHLQEVCVNFIWKLEHRHHSSQGVQMLYLTI